MTLKTSFFNAGIYKSTLRRNLWGGILYFLLLFISTGLAILLTIDVTRVNDYTYSPSFYNIPLILRSDYIIFPMLLAMVVPTIAALFIFKFIHSKKAAVFTHSIPVTRTANFISSVMAGLTLIVIPVILNTITLIIVSLCGYEKFFNVNDCFTWLFINLFALFIMFSASVFSSVITGNSFAMPVINILFHTFLLIVVSGFTVIAEVFLYGFSLSNNFFEGLINNNFACAGFSLGASAAFRDNFTALKAVEFILIALLIYFTSLILYKKRKIENAEDIAGFKCLNTIFKYLVTFTATVGAFGLFAHYISRKPVVFYIIVVMAAIISYFGVEMLLKKTFNVIKSYKGCLAFLAVFGVVITFFYSTSFFGYETYIPKTDEIKTATAYNFYRDEEPFSKNGEIIETVKSIHREFLKEENMYKIADRDYYETITVKYVLNNGKTIERFYKVKEELSREALNSLYKHKEYKLMSEPYYKYVDSIFNIVITGKYTDSSLRDENITDIKGFLDAFTKDIETLSYDELHPKEPNTPYISVNIQYMKEEKVRHYYFDVFESYTNTISWLKANNI